MWELPKLEGVPADAAAEAAALFDELGLFRYAGIARSERTAEIFATLAEGPGRGALARVLLCTAEASGVAPDTGALCPDAGFSAGRKTLAVVSPPMRKTGSFKTSR